MPGITAIDGLSSGLDTTAIVDAIIAAESGNVNLLEYEKASKTNIISTYKAFEAKLLALNTQIAKLTKASTYEQASISVTDDTYISATSNDDRVAAGSYDLQVLSLAKNHQMASQGFADVTTNTMGTGTIVLGVGDGSKKTITIDESNNSLIGIKNAINEAGAGVSATIINDGSDSNSYRLLLTSDKTGRANEISITADLTGGDSLNYSTATFDAPEMVNMDFASTSQISLGATAAFTGSENKTYTFTVAGTGSQDVGTDNVTINWSDGTNSGSILVTQADTEVELVGTGADGLKITLSAGSLREGDTFEVSTFAPLLQEATDARLAVGAGGGAGSPITVTSDTNEFSDIIGGIDLDLKKTTDVGQFITVTTGIDVTAVKSSINSFVQSFNEVMDFVDKQNEYNEDTKESGTLFGDYTLQSIQSSLRNDMNSKVAGLTSDFNQLGSIGIRTGTDGKISIRDSSLLDEALTDNLDEVIDLFSDSGNTTSGYIEFVSSTPDTRVGEEMEVDITQAATRGYFEGEAMSTPESSPLTLNSSNNKLQFKINGIVSEEIVLTEKTYNSMDELISEIQSKIDNDSKIGEMGLTAEWIDLGTDLAYIRLNSATYGSNSKIEIRASVGNSAFAALGLAGGKTHVGLNVEGTINGEEAEGKGQFLTGKEDNETTDGLKLKITMTDAQVTDGVEGTISFAKGVASKLNERLSSYTLSSDGLINRRVKAYENQIANLDEQIADYNEILTIKRETLMEQFRQMENVLGQLDATSQYLSSQIATLNNNWLFNKKN